MPRDKARVAACILAATAALSCLEPTRPTGAPKVDRWAGWTSWDVVFRNELSSEYGGASCGPGSTLYCRTWYADPYEFTGTLRQKADSFVLTLPAADYHASYSAWGDSLRIGIKVDAYCAGYGLAIPRNGDAIGTSFTGKYSYARDCHGSSKLGGITGRR